MSVADVVPFALLAGLVGMDFVTFPQVMISRPIVAATAAGALAGHPLPGLVIGALLELIALEILPFGASRYPEWGSASVVGGALYSAHPADPVGALAVAVAAALVTAMLSGWSMVRLRRLNVQRVARQRAEVDSGSQRAVTGTQLFGLTADFVRGAAVGFVALLVFAPLMTAVLGSWGSNASYSRAVVTAAAGAVAVGAVWKLFHSAWHARLLFLAGLAVGVALLFVR